MELRGVLVVEDPGDACDESASVRAIEHVANRPIAHHVLDALEAAGVVEVIVVSSERVAGRVRDGLATRSSSATMLRFVSHHGAVGLASALSLAAPIIDGAPCIVHAAGGLLAEPLAPLARSLGDGADAILTVHRSPSPDQPLSPTAQSLLDLAELDPSRSALGLAGVVAFGPGAVRRALDPSLADPAPGTPSAASDGSDLMVLAERIAGAGGSIHARMVDVWRVYHGEAADLLELNRIALDRIEPGLPQSVGDANRVEGRVHVHETASVTDSVLVGPAVIGCGARIAHAYIGPYTAIGAGALIEGAEIERSIVSPGARVSHVGSRMTDSVVGAGAHVFRDFSLPRALRVRIGADAELGLC